MPNVTSYSFLSLSGWNRKIIRVVILILYKLSNTINGYLTLVGKHYLSSIVESFVISTIRPIFTWKFATSKRSTCGYLKQWADSLVSIIHLTLICKRNVIVNDKTNFTFYVFILLIIAAFSDTKTLRKWINVMQKMDQKSANKWNLEYIM